MPALLNTYKALSFIRELSGGSTRPWAIFALGEDNTPQQFVVKLFKDKPLQAQPAVASEVMGSIMATLFDLPTPQPAFIDFTPEFIDTLSTRQLEQLSTSQGGLKFGCEFIEKSFPYNPALPRRAIAGYDVETVYAFDNLILNRDRDCRKPNMLLVGQELYVIDHEISTVGASLAKDDLLNDKWSYRYQDHVFYNLLRGRALEDIEKSFHTFTHYLQRANFSELLPYFEQLEELGFDVSHFPEFYDYLCYQKANSTQFEQVLKKTLL